MRAGVARSISQVTVKHHARINRERLVEFQVESFAGRRVQIELVNGATDGIQQLRPSLQRLRRYATATRLRFARGPAVKERHVCSALRKQLRGKRTRRSGADNQHIELSHRQLWPSPVRARITVVPSESRKRAL